MAKGVKMRVFKNSMTSVVILSPKSNACPTMM